MTCIQTYIQTTEKLFDLNIYIYMYRHVYVRISMYIYIYIAICIIAFGKSSSMLNYVSCISIYI